MLFDVTAPTVSSIVRAGASSAISTASADFIATFSESVTGVDAADFTLFTTGVTGASITGITPVLAGNLLASLPYTSGESYTVEKGSLTPPSVPVLVSPAVNFLTADYTPTLDWNNSTAPAGANFDHSQIQVATDAAFSTLVVDENIAGITNSTYTPAGDLAHNTKFYWRVRVVNFANGANNWSAVRYFRTLVDAPTLLSPANGANGPSAWSTFSFTTP